MGTAIVSSPLHITLSDYLFGNFKLVLDLFLTTKYFFRTALFMKSDYMTNTSLTKNQGWTDMLWKGTIALVGRFTFLFSRMQCIDAYTVTRRVPLLEQELLPLPENPS
jgi:hypothetical protein